MSRRISRLDVYFCSNKTCLVLSSRGLASALLVSAAYTGVRPLRNEDMDRTTTFSFIFFTHLHLHTAKVVALSPHLFVLIGNAWPFRVSYTLHCFQHVPLIKDTDTGLNDEINQPFFIIYVEGIDNIYIHEHTH